jgi:hypothetical protein
MLLQVTIQEHSTTSSEGINAAKVDPAKVSVCNDWCIILVLSSCCFV